MSALEDRLARLYSAFNAREIERVLEALAANVDWPNGMDGTRVQGREAVRSYWTEQWKVINPSVRPVGTRMLPDGRVALEIEQVVRDLSGKVLTERTVWHVYSFEGELVSRMDILDQAP